MKSALALWNRFERWLGGSGDPRPLALFRIGWSLAMLVASLGELTRAGAYASPRYLVPLHAFVVLPEQSGFKLFIGLLVAASCCALLGLCTRVAIAVVVLGHGYLLAADLLQFRNHIYLGVVLGCALVCGASGECCAVDAWLRKSLGRPGRNRVPLCASQLIRAQVLIVYGWSVINKLRPGFLDGFTLQEELPFALRTGLLRLWFMHPVDGALVPWLARAIAQDHTMAWLAWSVVLVEAFIFVGLSVERLRRPAVIVGVMLHAGIFLAMDVLTFGLLMVASYPIFMADDARSQAASASTRS